MVCVLRKVITKAYVEKEYLIVGLKLMIRKLRKLNGLEIFTYFFYKKLAINNLNILYILMTS